MPNLPALRPDRRRSVGSSTAVDLFIDGARVFGALVNRQWDFVGCSDNDANQLLIPPFLNYNLSDGWYLSSAPIITAKFFPPPVPLSRVSPELTRGRSLPRPF